MRIGVVIDLEQVQPAWVPELATAVEGAGLDMVWWRASGARSTLAAAAACSQSRGLLIGAEAMVDATHPIYLAEERNVVDQLLGGRMVLGLKTSGDGTLDEEWLRVLLAAGGTAPFQHEGDHFRLPAGLPENQINPEQLIRVTPAPFSAEPQVWISGAPGLASRYGVSPVMTDDVSASLAHDQWRAVDVELAERALRLRRPGIRRWDPAVTDAAVLAPMLATERDQWGMDTALIELSCEAGGSAWLAGLAELAGVVRPRVQTHTLPSGLEEFWDDMRTARQMTNEREVTT